MSSSRSNDFDGHKSGAGSQPAASSGGAGAGGTPARQYSNAENNERAYGPDVDYSNDEVEDDADDRVAYEEPASAGAGGAPALERKRDRRDPDGCEAQGAPPLRRMTREDRGTPSMEDVRRNHYIHAIKAWIARVGVKKHGIGGLHEIQRSGITRDGLLNDIVNAMKLEEIEAAIGRVQQLIDTILEDLERNQIPVFYTVDRWNNMKKSAPLEGANLLRELLQNVCAPGYPGLEEEVLDLLVRLYDGDRVTSVTQGAGGGLTIVSAHVTYPEFSAIVSGFPRMNADDEHDDDEELPGPEGGEAMSLEALNAHIAAWISLPSAMAYRGNVPTVAIANWAFTQMDVPGVSPNDRDAAVSRVLIGDAITAGAGEALMEDDGKGKGSASGAGMPESQ